MTSLYDDYCIVLEFLNLERTDEYALEPMNKRTTDHLLNCVNLDSFICGSSLSWYILLYTLLYLYNFDWTALCFLLARSLLLFQSYRHRLHHPFLPFIMGFSPLSLLSLDSTLCCFLSLSFLYLTLSRFMDPAVCLCSMRCIDAFVLIHQYIYTYMYAVH